MNIKELKEAVPRWQKFAADMEGAFGPGVTLMEAQSLRDASGAILSLISRVEALEKLRAAVQGQVTAGLGGRLLPSVVVALQTTSKEADE